ncbi:TRAF3-interacting protein 1 [Mactra antiquata]
MDPKIAKKTQDSLGKYIKKPPLTEKLLSKPPFRFLHDVMTSVIKTTGVMEGLFTEAEMNSENVKDKDSKIAFLQKAIDYVAAASGKQLGVKPAKVVAGHEPEKTNEFLQALASAIGSKVNNAEVLDSMSGKGGKSSKKVEKEEKPKEKERDKSSDRRKRDEEKRGRDRGEEKERSKDRDDRKKDGDDKHRGREDRHKDREDKHKDREDRHKDRDRERGKSGRSRHRREEQEKENDAPNENMVNGEHKSSDAPAKIQRPTSAKGSRRRMEDVPSVPGKREPSSTFGDDDVPPQVAAGRLARPSSARPAPPKRKEDVAQSEPAMRLGSGKPQNLILDDGRDSDEDETFVVEESANQPIEPEQPQAPLDDDDDEDHGGLVKKIMESKKEYEQPRETKIERPTISDAQRRKQREAVQREIDKLRGSIQTLTRSANPLGKIMDYVQEDLDSMQKELEKWKEENKEHALALRREKAITERAVEPLRVQLSEVDQAIKDQLELIGAVKSNIIRNDQKMEKMLRTIAKS